MNIIAYVIPKPPKGGSKTQCPKFEQCCDNSETVSQEVAYGLSIGTDLDDLERRNSSYFAFLHRIRYLQADYITVVEDRHIMSVKCCLPVLVFHFWPKLMHAPCSAVSLR